MFLKTILFFAGIQSLISAGQNKPFYDLNNAEKLFKSFLLIFAKSYPTKMEEQMRLENFRDTLKEINFLNAVNRDAVFDINEFADVSRSEFKLMHTGFVADPGFQWEKLEDPPCTTFYDQNITTKYAPPSFDWRDKNKVTRVRNQGKCGSCWAFSLIGNIESQYAILTNNLVQFSVQQLVDCVFSSEGCFGGDNLSTARTLISYGGVETEADYPYAARNQNCTLNRSKIKARISACSNFDLTNEDKIREVLFKTGPLSIVLDAHSLHAYSGGVMDYCPGHEQNHAVLLVGYGTEGGKDFWVLKNTWGSGWGEKGFFRLQRGIDACGFVNEKIVSTTLQI